MRDCGCKGAFCWGDRAMPPQSGSPVMVLPVGAPLTARYLGQPSSSASVQPGAPEFNPAEL